MVGFELGGGVGLVFGISFTQETHDAASIIRLVFGVKVGSKT